MTDGDRLALVPAAAAAGAAAEAFLSWRKRLRAALPRGAEVEHVGSTAVPGCATKGDLDIAVRVAPDDFPAADLALSGLLARNLGSDRTESFAAFKDDDAEPPLGVQLVVRGSLLDVFVRFRDLLRADPARVAAYSALKRAHQGADMSRYRAAKAAFIKATLAAPTGPP